MNAQDPLQSGKDMPSLPPGQPSLLPLPPPPPAAAACPSALGSAAPHLHRRPAATLTLCSYIASSHVQAAGLAVHAWG